MRHFSRRYRCITYSARGHLPSDVPDSADRYSQDRVRDDILAIFTGLGIDRAHIVGCSMGAFATLHFGMQYCTSAATSRALSLTLVGCGSGAHPAVHRQFKEESVERAQSARQGGKPVLFALREAPFHDELLSLDVAEIAHRFQKDRIAAGERRPRSSTQESDAPDFGLLLRQGRKRSGRSS
jgi:pimeloyl-ACP methyl ester carboxylesterase